MAHQRFKVLFFKTSVHFGTSDLIFAKNKLNLLPLNSVYLVFVFSRNAKKTQTDQGALQTFLLCRRRNILQTFKSNSCKKSLFQVCNIIDTTCVDECFLFHVITARHFFIQLYCYPKVCYSYLAVFFKTSVLKEVRLLCLLSLQ